MPERWLDVACVLVLALCASRLHPAGPLRRPPYYENDTRVFYYPLADWIGQQLKAGTFPLWLPNIFTGYPIFADGESGLLYLPQVLMLWLLPTAAAMVWLRTLHAFLAGLFMHLFLRTLRLGPLSALGGALVFALGSFLTAQMHHENVVRSAVWLPLILLLVERGLRAPTTRRRLGWLALAALADGQSALGLHIQPVLMEALAIGGYVLFRVVLGPVGWRAGWRGWTWRPTATWAALAIGAAVLGGVAVAFAQWLPLAEWARVSSRGGGVDYEFASAFGLAWENLPTILFPYFFRLPDGTAWWTLWQQWETEVYVGIPTLALALVGIFFSYRREVWYFLPLAFLALWVGMAHYAPFFNLHAVLWSLPGFDYLRAPGRFSYLFVFGFAGLAALGLQALVERRAGVNRLAIAFVGALPAAGLLAAILALFPAWRGWLAADPQRATAWINANYLSERAQFPIDPGLVYQGLLASLDLANPKTAWTLALLALTALAFLVWWELGTRRAWLGEVVFAALMAADLLVFAADFHPTASLASLDPTSLPGVPAGSRVFEDGTLPEVEPDSLVAAGLSTVEGYSSLPSERHFDLYDRTADQPTLRTLWAAPYVLEPTAPDDAHTAQGVTFRAEHPLVGGYQGTGSITFVPPTGTSPVNALRLVSSLGYSFRVPQGQSVGQIVVQTADGQQITLPIRAGIESAEQAIDRRSIQPLLLHQKPAGPTAFDFPDSAPDGEDYTAHLYLANLPLPAATAISSITITPTDPVALLQVQGLGLVAADGNVRSLGLQDEQGIQVVGQTDSFTVLHDATAWPRALVIDASAAVNRASQPDLTPAAMVAHAGFDPAQNVLIEDLPIPGTSGPREAPHAATVEDLGPNAVRITATADRPSFLVLTDFYHRGWTATVDGQSTPIGIADAVYRVVPLGAGTHVVEMRFQPLSHVLGAVGSGLSLLVIAGVLILAFALPALPRRR